MIPPAVTTGAARPEKEKNMTCDHCLYYTWDEEDEDYYCEADMDEDDYYHFLTDANKACPFYRSDDEYEVVRHQM